MDINWDNHRHQYLNALLQDVVPFWEQYSIDTVSGGFFTCLDAQGSCYDTDKFIWLQARQVWTFAMLYQRLDPQQRWLDIATHGIQFIEKFAFAPNGDCYFALDRQGNPLVAPYNIFSDCFVAMAYSTYATATGEQRYSHEALRLFNRIMERAPNPKGAYSKAVGGTRPLKNFALPMILCNLTLELSDVLPPEQVAQTIAHCTHEVLGHFWIKSNSYYWKM
ncbi:MAG: AGE family epimerase/isomerase [Saprospiraceae bacterium]